MARHIILNSTYDHMQVEKHDGKGCMLVDDGMGYVKKKFWLKISLLMIPLNKKRSLCKFHMIGQMST